MQLSSKLGHRFSGTIPFSKGYHSSANFVYCDTKCITVKSLMENKNTVFHGPLCVCVCIYIYMFNSFLMARNLTKAGPFGAPLGNKPQRYDPTQQNHVSGNPGEASSGVYI